MTSTSVVAFLRGNPREQVRHKEQQRQSKGARTSLLFSETIPATSFAASTAFCIAIDVPASRSIPRSFSPSPSATMDEAGRSSLSKTISSAAPLS